MFRSSSNCKTICTTKMSWKRACTRINLISSKLTSITRTKSYSSKTKLQHWKASRLERHLEMLTSSRKKSPKASSVTTTHLHLVLLAVTRAVKFTRRRLDKFKELLTSPLGEIARGSGRRLSTLRRNLHHLLNLLLIKAQSKERALVDSQSPRLSRVVQLKLRLAANQPNRLHLLLSSSSSASLTKFWTQMKFSLSTT